MKTSDNGGLLGHTCFFSQTSIFFLLPETLASIIKVLRYERNNAPVSQQQIFFRGNRKDRYYNPDTLDGS